MGCEGGLVRSLRRNKSVLPISLILAMSSGCSDVMCSLRPPKFMDPSEIGDAPITYLQNHPEVVAAAFRDPEPKRLIRKFVVVDESAGSPIVGRAPGKHGWPVCNKRRDGVVHVGQEVVGKDGRQRLVSVSKFVSTMVDGGFLFTSIDLTVSNCGVVELVARRSVRSPPCRFE